MKNKGIHFFSLILISLQSLFAQNLVVNPSFEEYDMCPDDIGQINRATGWILIRNTPEFFHKCATPSIFGNYGVPANSLGYQYPPSADCSGYAGLVTYSFSPNGREYFGSLLNTALDIGEKYFVSFKVVRASLGLAASNNIGLVFTTQQAVQGNFVPNKNYSHVNSDAVITDTLNWTTIFSSFTADSTYNYVEIGNFYDDTLTKVLDSNSSVYYFIDDVCVSKDSLYCASYIYSCAVGITDKLDTKTSLYPNPSNGLLYFDYSMPFLLYVYNIYGDKLLERSKLSNNQPIDLTSLSNGIYVVTMISKNKIHNSKIQIIH